MKATITNNGTLAITPETELEEFALRHWWGDWQLCKANLHVELTDGQREVSPTPSHPSPPGGE